jgi:hypothetical protein
MTKGARVTNKAVRALIAVLACGLAVGLASIASALHRFTPPLLQVTALSGGDIGHTAAWSADSFVFEGFGDIVGNCSDEGWQIFYYDHAARVLNGQKGLRQLTYGSFNASTPSISKTAFGKLEFFVAFEADGGLCSDARNNCDALAFPTTGRQVFVYENATGLIHQITRGPGDCRNPQISGNGRAVVFDSTTDLLGTNEIGAVPEVYRGDLRWLSPLCPQLPCPGTAIRRGLDRYSFGGGQHPTTDFRGLNAAFESSGDLLHSGANPGVQQIYLLRKGILSQITSGARESRHPLIKRLGGNSVAYEQDVQMGANVVTQISVTQVRKKAASRITQVTKGALRSIDPSLDPPGRRISFTSYADLVGNGSSGPQVFTFDLRRLVLTQLTKTQPNGAGLSAQSNAVIVAFRSADDLQGTGNATPQLWIANFFRSAPLQLATPQPATPIPQPTPTNTAVPGDPTTIGLALLTDQSSDNGNNTLTTVMAASVADSFGNPVPDGTAVHFTIQYPTGGAIVTDGQTNQSPTCDVSGFEQQTGTLVINQPGVAHACVIFPGALVGLHRTIVATVATIVGGTVTKSGVFQLPPPPNSCQSNGDPCNDHNPCTVSDVCAGGNPDYINPVTGQHEPIPPHCQPGTALTCPDDGNPCTVDVCNYFGGGCGMQVECQDDGNPCTDDICDESTGACGIFNTAWCTDENLCTTDDICTGGVCQGTPTVCPNDNNPCTNDVCDLATGLCGIPITPCVCPTP